MTYHILDQATYGRRYNGVISGETAPKSALGKYLLCYRNDKTTIQYTRTAARAQGCDYIVTCTETGRKYYYITM